MKRCRDGGGRQAPWRRPSSGLAVPILAALPALLAPGGARPAAAAVYEVGPGKRFEAIGRVPSLKPGDVVMIHPGTYNEVRRWADSGTPEAPIVIRGVGETRPVVDAEGRNVGGRMPNPRAVFQVEASHVVIENLEFKNARNGNNGAGIRVTGGGRNRVTNTVIRNCKITNCDMGMMSDGNDNLLVESCEIAFNGTERFSGYSHNLYLAGGRTTLRFCHIHDSIHGQNVKSRGHYTELLYNLIIDSQDGEVGLVDSRETASPNSNAVMIGNVVVSKDRGGGWNRERFVQFGQDMGGEHSGTLYAINNTFVAGTPRIGFLDANARGCSIVAVNNVFFGSGRISSGRGRVTGHSNWMPSGARAPDGFQGNVTGGDPGFMNVAGRDFRIAAGSPCRNAGAPAPEYVDGDGASHVGAPEFEYADMKGLPRGSDGKLDLGADEHGRAPETATASSGGTAGEGALGAAARLLRTSAARAQAKELEPTVIDAWTAKLLARTRAELAAGRRPRFFYSQMHQNARVLSAAEDGALRISCGVELAVGLDRLPLKDRKSLALSAARADSPADQCMVAFFLLAVGERDKAEERLLKGGAGAEEVRALFAPEAAPDEPEGGAK